ncbi:universal stress protein [Lederbergia wuyishanensis]|uniref:Nucleotide-binding universal stress UspA family protein n=1 Tax=Lederbergia wuyishanensis TaxID=1347903 RepID=A0ABU0D4Y6_9BACI|nr:universal stress protein [Lederbergia wuyishanensis]MCJ8009566.1 universal stress protein [Lederbergia wuyishanensis]MDQ0343472.1 nucleotide-binding universal stress UspA family protein [Lederbergia wuyishanensis]
MYKRILLAADGSENSIRAAKEAVKIASYTEGSVVEIVFVIDYSRGSSDILQSKDAETLDFERRKKLLPIEEMLNQAKVTYKVTLLHGDPGQLIVEYVNKQTCDMVVMGTRGLNALQEMVLGSVSHKVAKDAKCPVLIVK